MAKKKPDPDRDQEHRLEAERLRLLPKQTQQDYIAMYHNLARNPKLTKTAQAEARQRAKALARLLGLDKSPR